MVMATTRLGRHQAYFTYLREDQHVQLEGCDGMEARGWAVDIEQSGKYSCNFMEPTV